MGRTSAVLLTLLFAVAAACSSTSEDRKVAGSKKKTSTTTSSTVVEGAAVPEGAPGTPGAPAAGRTGGRAAAKSAGTAAKGATAPGGGAVPGGAPDLGPPSQGVTGTEVKIGFWVINTESGCQVVGADRGGTQGCTNSDAKAVDAFVKYVNAHGGVANRKIAPVIYETEATRDNYAGQAQAACSHFTEDHKVFLIVSEGEVGRDVMATCGARKNTPVIDPGFWAFDDKAYADLNGFLYQPDRIRPERWLPAYVDGLAAQGFFAPGTKLGLFRWDAAPFTRATNNVLKPRLASHNVTIAVEAVITTPGSVAALSDVNSQLSNAILRMRNEGVNRVIFFSTMAEMTLFFFQQADAQGFKPRYGVSSFEYLSRLTQNAPDDQLRNAVGIGWLPRFDVTTDQDPGGSQQAARCKEILQGAGLDAGAGRNSRCSAIFFLKATLDRARALNPAGFREAVEALGGGFEPGETFGASFGRGRYDGASVMRNVAFDNGCGCFKYTTGPKPLP